MELVNLIINEILTCEDGNINIELESHDCLISLNGWKKTEDTRILFVLGNNEYSAVACFDDYTDFPIPKEYINEVINYFN